MFELKLLNDPVIGHNLLIKERDQGYYFSPACREHDANPADIHTFIPSSQPKLFRKLVDYVDSLTDDHRLIENYRMDMTQFEAVSLWILDDKIIGFASAWNRKFYGNDTVRILNRFYQDQNEGRINFTRTVVRPSTLHCILHQMKIAQMLGYEWAFISREMRTANFFRNFMARLTTVGKVHNVSWQYERGPFRVAPGFDESCMQSVGVVNLLKNPTAPFFDRWEKELPE